MPLRLEPYCRGFLWLSASEISEGSFRFIPKQIRIYGIEYVCTHGNFFIINNYNNIDLNI